MARLKFARRASGMTGEQRMVGPAENLAAARRYIKAIESVALEIVGTGTLALPFQSKPAGARMRAHCAAFLQFKDGKIFEQRKYDCHDP